MVNTHPLTIELIERILAHLVLMQPRTLISCGIVNSVFGSISRKLNPLFQCISLYTNEDINTLYSFVTANSKTPITDYCRELSLTLPQDANEDVEKNAVRLLFKCRRVEIVELSHMNISLENDVPPMPCVHTVILDGITFRNGLTHFLRQFSRLSTVSMTGISDSCTLDSFSSSLPSTLRALNIAFSETEDHSRLRDPFLAWMVKYPHKVPEITQLCCIGIEGQLIDDIVLLLSLLKPSLTQLELGMRVGCFGGGESDLLSYVFTNDFPLVAYEGSEGSDLDDIIANYDSDSWDIE